MSDGYNMEISWGSVVVKLAAGDGNGGLRRGLSSTQAALYAGEMLDRIEAKVLLHDVDVRHVDGCGACRCVSGRRYEERVLVPRVERVGSTAVGCESGAVLRIAGGCLEEVPDGLPIGGSVESVPVVPTRGTGRDDELSGVRGSFGSVGIGEAGGFLRRSSVEVLRAGPDSVFNGVDDVCENVVGLGKQTKKNARKRARAKELKNHTRLSGGEVDAFGVNAPGAVGAVPCVVGSGEFLGDERSGDSVSEKVRDGSSGSSRFERADLLVVTTDAERKVLARQWYERKSVENQLAIQRARYNVKRNEYLDRSRISEQRWETERLNCDAKLARISAMRLGGVVGSAKTVVSEEELSLRPPSLSTGSDSPAELSDGTVSPDSSISVAEGVKLNNKNKKLEGENAELRLKYDTLVKAVSMGGSKIVIDGKDIHEYDGTGQYVPPFEEEVESLYDGRGHLLDAWEAGIDY